MTKKVNTKQVKVEARILGYLIGRKIANDTDAYAPEFIDRYPTLPLQKLNALAQRIYLSFSALKNK